MDFSKPNHLRYSILENESHWTHSSQFFSFDVPTSILCAFWHRFSFSHFRIHLRREEIRNKVFFRVGKKIDSIFDFPKVIWNRESNEIRINLVYGDFQFVLLTFFANNSIFVANDIISNQSICRYKQRYEILPLKQLKFNFKIFSIFHGAKKRFSLGNSQ